MKFRESQNLLSSRYRRTKIITIKRKFPEIISFTEFLRWNYTLDYGQYIRNLHSRKQLPLTWYNSPDSKITNVVIIDGKYDRIDEFSFYMYIICSVTFYYEGIFQQQCYCVNGYCNIAEKSDFLCDVSIYDGKRFRLKNPLNEFLVPILPKKRYDETALQILSNYYPFRYDIPCVISGLALAKEMGYHIQYARLSLDGKVKSKVIFEEKNITAFDEYGLSLIHI